MLMSNINELSVSSRTVQSKIIESNGNMTFRLQDKEVTENGNVTADVGYDALSKVNVNVQGGGGSGNILYAWYNSFSSSDGDDWKRYLYTDKENLVNGENVNCLVINSSYNIKILKKNCIFQQAFSDSKIPYPCLKIGSKFYKTNGSSLSDEVETTCPIPSSEYIYTNAIKVVEVEGVTYHVDTDNNVIKTGSMIAIGRGGNEKEIYTYLKNGTTVSDTSIVDIINNKIINKEYEEPILTSYLSGETHYDDCIALYYFLDPLSYFFNGSICYIRDNESDVE